MPFSVNDFRSSFVAEPQSSGFFEVRVLNAPTILPSTIARDLVYRCQNAELPGRTLATADRITAGPIRKVAYGSIYDEITLSFIVSGTMDERNYFSSWQHYIHDPTDVSDVAYYSEYVGTIQIVTYNDDGHENYSVKLIEAFPTSIKANSLGWEMKNEYMKLDVTFAFHHWVESIPEKPKFGLNDLVGTLSKSIQLANNIKQLSSALKSGNIIRAGASILPVIRGAAETIAGVKTTLGLSISTTSNNEDKKSNIFLNELSPFISKGSGGGIGSGPLGGQSLVGAAFKKVNSFVEEQSASNIDLLRNRLGF